MDCSETTNIDELESKFNNLDKTYLQLREQTYKLSSLAADHSETNYSPEIEVLKIGYRDGKIESQVSETVDSVTDLMFQTRRTLESLKNEIENIEDETARERLKSEHRWYKERYTKLNDELNRIRQTGLIERTGDTLWERKNGGSELEYNRVEFDIEDEIVSELQSEKA